MSSTVTISSSSAAARSASRSPALARLALLLVIAAAIGAGLLASFSGASPLAAAQDGAAFTRLLRFMAAVKGLIAVGATAAVFWRLGAAITPPWFAAYALCAAGMAAGPVLIWNLAHIGFGALLLHGGLVATILLLWRDPAVANRLGALVATRRSLDANGRFASEQSGQH